MTGYLARRLALGISMVWTVSFVTFVAFGLALNPATQFDLCLDAQCKEHKAMLLDRFHLDAPILDRYWLWFTGLFRHGFGDSTINFDPSTPAPIGPEVSQATWVTIQLLAVSLVLVAVGSLALGFISSRFAGSPFDWAVRLGSYVAWSIPPFVMGVIFIRILLPTGWLNLGHLDKGFGGWLRWVLPPAIALALGLIGLYGRYIRTEMLDSLSQPYADVARGKGLTEQQVASRHALRNSLIPVIGVASLEFTAIIGASLAIDYVFQLNGLAALFLRSASELDPFLLTAILVVIAGVVACGTFVADAILGSLDPRIRSPRTP